MVQKDTISKYSYLKPFLDYSIFEIHLAKISKILELPHPTVRRYLSYFEKKGILKKSIKGNLSFYSLNKNNPIFFEYIFLAEKDYLLNRFEKDLKLKEIINYINLNFNNSKVLIFGSSVDGVKKANDIDVLIVGNEKISFLKLERIINKKIHTIQVKNFKDINQSLKEEIKKKHLLIQGTEYFIKWLL